MNDKYYGIAPRRWTFIKLCCAIAVVVSHVVKIKDLGNLSFFYDAGGYAVSVFFFLSGYGLAYSIVTKPYYMQGFFRKRFMYILATYLTASFFYMLVSYSIGFAGNFHLLQLFALNPILPYGWYFVVLLLFYLAVGLFKITPPHICDFACMVYRGNINETGRMGV